jgi:hypothetical protein
MRVADTFRSAALYFASFQHFAQQTKKVVIGTSNVKCMARLFKAILSLKR